MERELATMPGPDVAPLVPEARLVARAAAEVYVRHTYRWLMGLLAHGSALKGGFIPGCSDLDLQLYLADEAFDDSGRLPLDLGLAIQRDLASVPTGPFQYIQCYPRSARTEDGLTAPIPGAYHMLLGVLPIPEATAPELRASAQRALASLRPIPDYIQSGLLTYSQERLERNARLICTDVWPFVYQLLILNGHDPIAMWRLPKAEAVTLLPETHATRNAARAFHAAAREAYDGQRNPGRFLTLIARGVKFREAAAAWYRDHIASAEARA